MALDSKVPRFLIDYISGITAPWFVSLNQSVNSSVGLMGTLLQQSRDTLAQNNVVYTNTQNLVVSASNAADESAKSSTQASQYAQQASDQASQVQALVQSFGKLYLGDHDADPSDAVDGARYYNTSSKRVRVFLNGQWQDMNQDAQTATHDATIAATQAAQAAAASNSLYSQTAQNTAQSQNLVQQAQSILSWMNTYFLGSQGSAPNKDLNGNDVTNGAFYYDQNLRKVRAKQDGQWKEFITNDETDNIRQNYIQGTWALGNGTTQVKGITWSNNIGSPVFYYVDGQGNNQTRYLVTNDQLNQKLNNISSDTSDKISGTLGMWGQDKKGFALHWNGNQPVFGYGDSPYNLTFVNLAMQQNVDSAVSNLNNRINDLNNWVNQKTGQYVPLDGSRSMYGNLIVDRGNSFRNDGWDDAFIHVKGGSWSGPTMMAPSLVSENTQDGGGYMLFRSIYNKDTNQTSGILYHGSWQGGNTLTLKANGQTITQGDLYVGGDGRSKVYGRSSYIGEGDLAE